LEHSGELIRRCVVSHPASLAHVLAQGPRDAAWFDAGFSRRDGLYYDFILSAPLTEKTSRKSNGMRKILKSAGF
jgi:hypothetical protein